MFKDIKQLEDEFLKLKVEAMEYLGYGSDEEDLDELSDSEEDEVNRLAEEYFEEDHGVDYYDVEDEIKNK